MTNRVWPSSDSSRWKLHTHPPSANSNTRERGASISRTTIENRLAQRHAVADGQVLQLGDDVVGVVDTGAEQVLEHGVAVQPAAVLAELDQPRPDLFGGGVDGDGARVDTTLCAGNRSSTGRTAVASSSRVPKGQVPRAAHQVVEAEHTQRCDCSAPPPPTGGRFRHP